jgi:hypothetical protein
VLQQREFERVGRTEVVKVDVRIVAATNKDLAAKVKARRFREDLYFRLNVVAVTLPPLRARTADVPQLVSHFLKKFADSHGKAVTGLARRTLNRLLGHDGPGTVRELEHASAASEPPGNANIGQWIRPRGRRNFAWRPLSDPESAPIRPIPNRFKSSKPFNRSGAVARRLKSRP